MWGHDRRDFTDKQRVHLVYVTDGTQAPEPVVPWLDTVSPDLGTARKRESVAAMASLGVPEGNLYFLDLPERRLVRHAEQLRHRVAELLDRIRPDHVLTPFRFDRHRDHIALNRAVTTACRSRPGVALTEYFVSPAGGCCRKEISDDTSSRANCSR